MAKQQLNRPDISAALEQMYGERMAQGMRCNGFENVTPPMRLLAFMFDRASGNGAVGTIARKQPVTGSVPAPPLS